MFKLNGLPLVKFPQNIVTKELQNLINDASCSVKPKVNPQSQTETEKVTEYLSDDNAMEIQFKNKRVRENGSPTQPKNKKEKPTETTEEQINESNENNVSQKHSSHLFVAPTPIRQSRAQAQAKAKIHQNNSNKNNSNNNSRSSSTDSNRSRSHSRENKFIHAKPIHTKCRNTLDIGITVYLKESQAFECKEEFIEEYADKISTEIGKRNITFDYNMEAYEYIKLFITRDFRDKHINMYECKYVSIPNNEYNNHAEELIKKEKTKYEMLIEKKDLNITAKLTQLTAFEKGLRTGDPSLEPIENFRKRVHKI